MDKGSTQITPFEIGPIFCADDILAMIKQLEEKIGKDNAILGEYKTKENNIVYLRNLYALYWLKFDYYNLVSLSSRLDESDSENGWFIWLKNYRFSVNKSFKDEDERNSYFYDKYFDRLMPLVHEAGNQSIEAVFCYKQGKYFACACVLFSCVEKVQRSISNFDPSHVFRMSEQLQLRQVGSIVCFNKDYFATFESRMNDFLRNNFYSKSTESDPEPKEINRNRIMHGIFTRDVSKTDCLKLFVLLNTLLQFDDWLNCFRKMKDISCRLKNI